MKLDGLNPASVGGMQGGGFLDRSHSTDVGKGDFKKTLDGILSKNLEGAKVPEESAAAQLLKFSNHALDRMNTRGMSFTPDMMDKINGAVLKAEGKGAKDALVVTPDSALIVNVASKTVVTVMDRDMLKDNVFTKIDAAILV